jgi:hypothetical protein
MSSESTDSSLTILWRGSDAAKFTALQAALRDEDIQFWHAQVYDPAGGFLSSRPYYLEASPGFEIRVHGYDLQRAKSALEWVESKANISGAADEISQPDDKDPLDSKPLLPSVWDSDEATSEVWSGEEEAMAEYLASALRENGIPSRVPDEPENRVRLCVRAADVQRARKIVGEVSGASPS